LQVRIANHSSVAVTRRRRGLPPGCDQFVVPPTKFIAFGWLEVELDRLGRTHVVATQTSRKSLAFFWDPRLVAEGFSASNQGKTMHNACILNRRKSNRGERI
jgi:hypothetical protein